MVGLVFGMFLLTYYHPLFICEHYLYEQDTALAYFCQAAVRLDTVERPVAAVRVVAVVGVRVMSSNQASASRVPAPSEPVINSLGKICLAVDAVVKVLVYFVQSVVVVIAVVVFETPAANAPLRSIKSTCMPDVDDPLVTDVLIQALAVYEVFGKTLMGIGVEDVLIAGDT
jgi:hypothetical protein